MSTLTSVTCKGCGAANEVLVPDDSFDEQMKYAALQFACRVCGGSLAPADGAADVDSTSTPKSR